MNYNRLVLVVVLVSVATGMFAAGAANRVVDAPRVMDQRVVWEIVPLQGVGPFTIGMTRTELSETLGEPDHVYRPESGKITEYLLYSDAGLSFHVVDQTVTGITCLSPSSALKTGLRVGMDWRVAVHDWESELGRPIRGQFTEQPARSYYWIDEFSLLLEMDAFGTIREISLEPTLEGTDFATMRSSDSVTTSGTFTMNNYPRSHLQRLSGTGLSLDTYSLAGVTPSRTGTTTTYKRLPDVAETTTGEAFLAAIPEIWRDLPRIESLVDDYGYPPTVLLSSRPDGLPYLNLDYGTGTLYCGPEGDTVIEIRFHRDETGFTYRGIGVGSSLDQVVAQLGEPRETVEGATAFADRVLYLNPNGGGYLKYGDLGVRFFFWQSDTMRTVNAMYLLKPSAKE